MLKLTHLIEQSIASLRGLSNSVSEDVDAWRQQPLNTLGRVEKELLLSISILLPKLEEARRLLEPTGPRQSRCEHCDDQ